MANLTAIPTPQGLEILNTELKEKATHFVLVGAKTYQDKELDEIIKNRVSTTMEDIKTHIFYSDKIESSFYDENGVLTFVMTIPVDKDLNDYMYGVGIVTSDLKELVAFTDTPKIVPIKGVGGTLSVKIAVRGEAGEIIFKKNDYITSVELDELYFPALEALTARVNELEKILIDKGVIDG